MYYILLFVLPDLGKVLEWLVMFFNVFIFESVWSCFSILILGYEKHWRETNQWEDDIEKGPGLVYSVDTQFRNFFPRKSPHYFFGNTYFCISEKKVFNDLACHLQEVW